MNNSQKDSKQGQYQLTLVVRKSDGQVTVPPVNGKQLETFLSTNTSMIEQYVRLLDVGFSLPGAPSAGSSLSPMPPSMSMTSMERQRAEKEDLKKKQHDELTHAYRHLWCEWGNAIKKETQELIPAPSSEPQQQIIIIRKDDIKSEVNDKKEETPTNDKEIELEV